MQIEACWNYLTEIFPPQPRLCVRVINFMKREFLNLNVMVDTGFSGYLSLHEEAINELNLEPLGRSEILTIKGTIETQVYLAKVEVVDPERKLLYKMNRHSQDNFIRINDEVKSLERYPIDVVLIHGLGLPLIGLRGMLTRNWGIFNSHNALCLLK